MRPPDQGLRRDQRARQGAICAHRRLTCASGGRSPDAAARAAAIATAREAALADEGGKALDQALVAHGAPAAAGEGAADPLVDGAWRHGRSRRNCDDARHITRFTVEFGDCDPAQIVFYPNFFRWMDAASLHFFAPAGVPPWREMRSGDRHHRHAAGRRFGALPAAGDATAT